MTQFFAAIDITPSVLFDPLIKGINGLLPRLPEIIVSLLAAYFLIWLSMKVLRNFLRYTHLPAGLKNVLLSLIRVVLWIFVAIAILQLLGLGNVAIAASVPIALIGVALAGGVAPVIMDVLSGVFLARDPDFKLGDHLKVGDPVTEGIVESMDTRRVRIRDKNDKLHVIPNSVIERNAWVVVNRKGKNSS